MAPPKSAEPRSGDPIRIDVSIEAGKWAGEADMLSLCRKAVDASVGMLDRKASPAGSELSVLFTDDAAIRSLNAEWRGKD